jgi:hypothetical protein
LFLFSPFIVVLGGDTLWHLQRFLQCVNYIILEFTSSTLYFIPSPPIHGTVSTGIIFAFKYMCNTLFAPYPLTYLYHLPPPTGAYPSPWAQPVMPSCSLLLQKRKEKI